MESQSRWDNLLIDGIPESENESWIDCDKKVRDLLEHTMGVTNVKNVFDVTILVQSEQTPNDAQ